MKSYDFSESGSLLQFLSTRPLLYVAAAPLHAACADLFEPLVHILKSRREPQSRHARDYRINYCLFPSPHAGMVEVWWSEKCVNTFKVTIRN